MNFNNASSYQTAHLPEPVRCLHSHQVSAGVKSSPICAPVRREPETTLNQYPFSRGAGFLDICSYLEIAPLLPSPRDTKRVQAGEPELISNSLARFVTLELGITLLGGSA